METEHVRDCRCFIALGSCGCELGKPTPVCIPILARSFVNRFVECSQQHRYTRRLNGRATRWDPGSCFNPSEGKSEVPRGGAPNRCIGRVRLHLASRLRCVPAKSLPPTRLSVCHLALLPRRRQAAWDSGIPNRHPVTAYGQWYDSLMMVAAYRRRASPSNLQTSRCRRCTSARNKSPTQLATDSGWALPSHGPAERGRPRATN